MGIYLFVYSSMHKYFVFIYHETNEIESIKRREKKERILCKKTKRKIVCPGRIYNLVKHQAYMHIYERGENIHKF